MPKAEQGDVFTESLTIDGCSFIILLLVLKGEL